MVDVFTPEERSRIMGRIGGKNTKPELVVRRLLHAMGYRFRLHAANLPGKPDIVLPRFKSVIFVHGCFWHSHPGCRRATFPSTNTAFWRKKLDGTKARDAANLKALAQAGWKTLVVWECETKDAEALSRTLSAFLPR